MGVKAIAENAIGCRIGAVLAIWLTGNPAPISPAEPGGFAPSNGESDKTPAKANPIPIPQTKHPKRRVADDYSSGDTGCCGYGSIDTYPKGKTSRSTDRQSLGYVDTSGDNLGYYDTSRQHGPAKE